MKGGIACVVLRCLSHSEVGTWHIRSLDQCLVVSRIYDFEIQASVNVVEHVEGEGCTGFIQP